MKTLIKLALVVLVVAIAIPVVKYRTVNPCEMLKKERIEQIREGIETASDEASGAVDGRSERAERIIDDVGETLEGLADDLAETVVELEVDEMSTGECVAELWKTTRND